MQRDLEMVVAKTKETIGVIMAASVMQYMLYNEKE